MISDNNLSAAPPEHLEAVIDELVRKGKRVVFDNGFDCKHITDDLVAKVAKLKFYRNGMRLAFDRIEEDGLFQEAVARLRRAGVPKYALMAYVLFNFTDTPREADYRMRECLNVGVRPYPQQFTPLNQTSREKTYVSKHWTKNLLRNFRFFWLMYGYYSKMTFEQFARTGISKHPLTEEDWDAWYRE